MKRKTLTTAVLAGVAGAAGIVNISSAVNMNMDGLGEVLIYPFYTVNAGNDTLISVVNTTQDVKAVKVRFLESRDSQEVLDFNLYMSPFDVWVAAVTGDPDGGPARIIQPAGETTCTVPQIPAGGQDFLTLRLTERFDSDGNGTFDSIIDNSPERTREGHFEVIEMGVVREEADPPNSRSPLFSATRGGLDGLEAAAIHGAVDGSASPACSLLTQAWTSPSSGQNSTFGGGVWAVHDADHDVEAPEGGLFGGASIINVNAGYQVSYNADAIEAFFNPGLVGLSDLTTVGGVSDGCSDGSGECAGRPVARLTLHSAPGDENPDLSNSNSRDVTMDDNVVRTVVFHQGRVIQSDFAKLYNAPAGVRNVPVDPISALYMRSAIHNEYVVDSALNAATEWVVTFPTKRFYVTQDRTFSTLFGFRPFTRQFGEVNGTLGACEDIRLSFYDREENEPTQSGGVNFSPSNPGAAGLPRLCQETQVITFAQDGVGIGTGVSSAVLGSPNSQNIAVDSEGYISGWTTIEFDGQALARARNASADSSLNRRFLGSVDQRPGTSTSCPTGPVSSADIDPGFFNDADCYHGLPVTGFAVQIVQNGTLTDENGGAVLSNYGGIFGHRAARIIEGS